MAVHMNGRATMIPSEDEGAADDDAGVQQHQLDQSQLSVEIVTANQSSPGPAL